MLNLLLKANILEGDVILRSVIAASMAFLGFIIGAQLQEASCHREAIRYGLGRYSPKTGEFEWLPREESERDYVTEVHNQMIMNRLNNQKCK
jgi:hypothetical protein